MTFGTKIPFILGSAKKGIFETTTRRAIIQSVYPLNLNHSTAKTIRRRMLKFGKIMSLLNVGVQNIYIFQMNTGRGIWKGGVIFLFIYLSLTTVAIIKIDSACQIVIKILQHLKLQLFLVLHCSI